MSSAEFIASGKGAPLEAFLPAIELREYVSETCGARGLSTGTATLRPGAELPCHTHPFSEAVTVLSGEGLFVIRGRGYRLGPLDCIHIPAEVEHRVLNAHGASDLAVHWAFASDKPVRTLVDDRFGLEDRGWTNARAGDPEYIRRFAEAEVYELSEGAWFRDMFGSRFGSVGVCGGYGLFQPGASLPAHIHFYDESITIVTGEAVCQVQGKQYTLSGCDTAFVPERRPHRFLNWSGAPMEMIWVYGGNEPERTVVDSRYCTGELHWPPNEGVSGAAI